MDTTLLVAIISGVVAIISVIISSVVTIISVKRAKQSEKELEEYKFILEGTRLQYGMGKDVITNRINIFGQACTHIQIIRDNVKQLSITTDYANESLPKIKEASEALLAIYQQNHFAVPPLESSILHDVKSQARHVYRICKTHLEDKKQIGDVNKLLQPLHNAQIILVREYQKWNSFLFHINDPKKSLFFDSLFPILEDFDTTRE